MQRMQNWSNLGIGTGRRLQRISILRDIDKRDINMINWLCSTISS